MAFGGADLHCHSTVSDGLEPPASLVRRAVESGLAVLALTDHDAVHGLPELEESARGTGLVTVAGVELSTRREGEDVHLLGLFVDPGEPELVARLLEMRQARDRRGEAMVARLAEAGIHLDLPALRRTVGDGAFGRPHVARALVERGAVGNVREAFDRFLTPGRPGYVPKPRWSLGEAIAAVRRAGGLSFLAHPVWYGTPEAIRALVEEPGLDGVETVHPDHDIGSQIRLTALASEKRLLVSGGSDYHGPPEGKKAVGACRLGEEEWLRLAGAARERRAVSGRAPVDLSPR